MANTQASFPPDQRSATGRLPQLDGLRGLAILGVLVNHFGSFAGSPYWGWLGVNLFFVLSGFLITRILLTQQQEVLAFRGSRLRALVIFYARRTLRIFPLYYLTLAVLWICAFDQSRPLGWWLGTYTYNLRLTVTGWRHTYDHFWSLCVEEQFYLVWPFVVLTCTRRKLGVILVLAFLAAPLWRLGCLCWGTSRFPLMVLPWACLDCLAAGALLAYCERSGRALWQRFLGGCRVGGLMLMALWLGLLLLERPVLWGSVPVEALIGNTAMALFFAWVVGRATEQPRGDWGTLLSMHWLTYLGTISYGVYILHNFMRVLWDKLASSLAPLAIPPACGYVVLSILAASASWYLFERPIQRWKEVVRYAAPRPPKEIRYAEGLAAQSEAA